MGAGAERDPENAAPGIGRDVKAGCARAIAPCANSSASSSARFAWEALKTSPGCIARLSSRRRRVSSGTPVTATASKRPSSMRTVTVPVGSSKAASTVASSYPSLSYCFLIACASSSTVRRSREPAVSP